MLYALYVGLLTLVNSTEMEWALLLDFAGGNIEAQGTPLREAVRDVDHGLI